MKQINNNYKVAAGFYNTAARAERILMYGVGIMGIAKLTAAIIMFITRKK